MFPDLGLEKTPQEFIERMVAIFAEVYRVLRDDGCVWLNFGDCYATAPKGSVDKGTSTIGEKHDVRKPGMFGKKGFGLTQGNLMLMPHRIAIALQDWGWVVRNDVVWFKRNPMPESQSGWSWVRHKIKDENDKWMDCPGCEKCLHTNPNWPQLFVLKEGSFRHTRAHEFVFMLTKKMQYWSNQEAVREAISQSYLKRWGGFEPRKNTSPQGFDVASVKGESTMGANSSGRNPRSVMDVPTAPYKGSHYATFPPNLIAPLIRATCPRWACPVCGQGWSPVVEKGELTKEDSARIDEWNYGKLDEFAEGEQIQAGKASNMRYTGFIPNHIKPTSIKGYRPTCSHPHTKDEAVPGIVLDPFVGSGTTVMVAQQLLRCGIGLDISLEYLDNQAKLRTGTGQPSNQLDNLPMFAELES